MIGNSKRRGRPARQEPDARTPIQRRNEKRIARHQKAMLTAAVFNELPDNARIRQPVVEILHGISSTTVWRRVKDGTLPNPRVDGRVASWSAGSIRTSLAGAA